MTVNEPDDEQGNEYFGNRSKFAIRSQRAFRYPTGNPFETLRDRETLVDAFFELYQALDMARERDPENRLDAQQSLENAIKSFNEWIGASNSNAPSGKLKDAYDQEIASKCFRALFNTSAATPGYWIAYQIAVDALEKVLLEPELTQPPQDFRYSAVAPVLFFLNEHESGYVFWLEVELFDDFPGVFVPDVLKFGLTDISNLLEPMQEVWEASGLSETFRGRWRITSDYPGDDPTFKNYNQEAIYPDELSGRSLQAAALAALWAASGQIPVGPVAGSEQTPETFTLDGKPLALNPQIAISARIDLNTTDRQNDSIALGAISDGSMGPKADAMSRYSLIHQPNETMFDSLIVVGKDVDEVRTRFTKADEDDPEYRGLRIIEDCQTMADALDWMLEVNAWKKSWNEACQAEWESQWGFARDEEGRFLTAAADFIRDEQGRPIKIDDENNLTVEGIDSNNESLNDEQIQKLRQTLEREGFNTGSLAFMQNPVRGARETDAQRLADAEASLRGDE